MRKSYLKALRRVAAIVPLVWISNAADAAGFFAGKTISFIVGTAAGGGNDLYARVLAQHLPRHIVGNPSVIVQNMPGANGVAAARYMFNIASKDGTVIATCPASMLLSEAMDPGNMKFDSLKFGWLGTIATTTDLLAVFRSTGVSTLAEAKATPLRIGASDRFSLSAIEPALANAVIGTKFRIINGYSGGGNALNLAMEQHEIDGRTNQWASWKVLRPEWISQKKLSYLLQFGPKDPELPNSVPALDELISAPADKAAVETLEITQYIGRSVFAPPDIPAGRLKTLRDAFNATMHDPAFVAQMRKLNLDLHPRDAGTIREELTRARASRALAAETLKSKLDLQ